MIKTNDLSTIKEIERRWLVSDNNADIILSSLKDKIYYQLIRQVYNLSGKYRMIELPYPDNVYMHIEKTKTIDPAGQYSVSTEVITHISEEQWEIAKRNVIPLRKTRFLIPNGSVTIELDIFKIFSTDSLEPFRFNIAEIEFSSEKEASGFNPLDWFDREITNDDSMTNRKIFEYINLEPTNDWARKFIVGE